KDFILTFDAFGFDFILVETVGVGQTELDIVHLATTTIVVLVPEAGDAVQTMKAGLMEIADIFVVNKADRPGAEEMKTTLAGAGDTPVVLTEALNGRGVEELWKQLVKSAGFT
ncbi:MAG: methylmalonyl Co-A mutase-associated GTPase MeaB, partial [Deltaproteobacteria bacterium]|nr:methylmalonyl Co-A mutase-associated GTPase MeaB [Deltaproteobacteria bacterium]